MLKKHKADALADKLEKDVQAVFEWVQESEAYRRIGFVTRPLSKRAAKMLRKTAMLETERDLLLEACDDWQAMFRQQTKYGEELEAERDQLRKTISRVAVLLHEAGVRTDRCTTADAVKSLTAERDAAKLAIDAAHEALELSGEDGHYVGKARRILAAAIKARNPAA